MNAQDLIAIHQLFEAGHRSTAAALLRVVESEERFMNLSSGADRLGMPKSSSGQTHNSVGSGLRIKPSTLDKADCLSSNSSKAEPTQFNLPVSSLTERKAIEPNCDGADESPTTGLLNFQHVTGIVDSKQDSPSLDESYGTLRGDAETNEASPAVPHFYMIED